MRVSQHKPKRYPSWEQRFKFSLPEETREILRDSTERYARERGIAPNLSEYLRHLVWADKDGEVTNLICPHSPTDVKVAIRKD